MWTTTPWTLVSNTATAVHPTVTYVAATDGTETLVVAEPLLAVGSRAGWTVVNRFTGSEMEGWRYDAPFDLVDIPDAHLRRRRRVRDHRGRHRAGPPGTGVRGR